jgi:hypothetical protein
MYLNVVNKQVLCDIVPIVRNVKIWAGKRIEMVGIRFPVYLFPLWDCGLNYTCNAVAQATIIALIYLEIYIMRIPCILLLGKTDLFI